MLRALLVLTITALPALAGEYAVLASGRRIHADRHELLGDVVRLYNKNGVTELPASAVESLEVEDFFAPPEPPPVEAKPVVEAPKLKIAGAQKSGPEGSDSRRRAA